MPALGTKQKEPRRGVRRGEARGYQKGDPHRWTAWPIAPAPHPGVVHSRTLNIKVHGAVQHSAGRLDGVLQHVVRHVVSQLNLCTPHIRPLHQVAHALPKKDKVRIGAVGLKLMRRRTAVWRCLFWTFFSFFFQLFFERKRPNPSPSSSDKIDKIKNGFEIKPAFSEKKNVCNNRTSFTNGY